MLFDHCTWDDDYKKITQDIRRRLLKLAHVSEETYTCVLMQGSGTFGVESVLTSAIGPNDCLLIAANGAYGERMADIAAAAKAVKEAGRNFIVDAMSSFGGVDIPVEELGIDYIISSANKCIQGVPGFSFIICIREELKKCEGQARSLSLDLYDQWKTMEKDGKWRFTSPTHVVLAFSQALKEMEEEGGIPARHARYAENNRILIEKMEELGIRPYIEGPLQGPIITTFYYPEHAEFSF
jgi:2-aminoethylphosphonate-pyruvate transaminase